MYDCRVLHARGLLTGADASLAVGLWLGVGQSDNVSHSLVLAVAGARWGEMELHVVL